MELVGKLINIMQQEQIRSDWIQIVGKHHEANFDNQLINLYAYSKFGPKECNLIMKVLVSLLSVLLFAQACVFLHGVLT